MAMTTTPKSILTVVVEQSGDLFWVLTSDQVLEERRQIEEQRRTQRSSDARNKTTVEDLIPGDDIRLQVSTAVITRASPVVQKWLREGSLHRQILELQGYVEFFDEEICPEALEHILRFLHYEYEEVPVFNTSIPLDVDTFLRALVIIDKLDLHKATALLKREWWPALSNELPRSVGDYYRESGCDLRAWISITFIMGKKAELNRLLEIYKICTPGFPDDDHSLPLPDRLQMAEAQRLAAFRVFNKALETYYLSSMQWSPVEKAVCNCSRVSMRRECDKQIYEALERSFAQKSCTFIRTSRKRGPAGSNALQIDPGKISFHELQLHVSAIGFTHPCQTVRDNEEKERLVKFLIAAKAGLHSSRRLSQGTRVTPHVGNLIGTTQERAEHHDERGSSKRRRLECNLLPHPANASQGYPSVLVNPYLGTVANLATVPGLGMQYPTTFQTHSRHPQMQQVVQGSHSLGSSTGLFLGYSNPAPQGLSQGITLNGNASYSYGPSSTNPAAGQHPTRHPQQHCTQQLSGYGSMALSHGWNYRHNHLQVSLVAPPNSSLATDLGPTSTSGGGFPHYCNVVRTAQTASGSGTSPSSPVDLTTGSGPSSPQQPLKPCDPVPRTAINLLLVGIQRKLEEETPQYTPPVVL